MAIFSVVLLTAAPPATAGETGGIFAKIDNREVLLRSVELFLNRDNVKQIQACFLPQQMDDARRKLSAHLSFSGVKMLQGGPGWMDQIATAAATISPDATHVIVHDAARPAVPYTDLEALIEMAPKHEAVALAAAVRTALVEVDEGGGPMAVHSASRFMQLLTPQVFSRSVFAEMAASRREPHAARLKLLKGSLLNARVGSGGDAGFVKAMLNMLPKPKVKGPLTPFEEAQW
jgi:2-C-methyl-D-erythritol 4-phosphate cytidylyltransferase/2-C-methyl-D-erythritol 2,4-cyclodiphosphate synthase